MYMMCVFVCITYIMYVYLYVQVVAVMQGKM